MARAPLRRPRAPPDGDRPRSPRPHDPPADRGAGGDRGHRPGGELAGVLDPPRAARGRRGHLGLRGAGRQQQGHWPTTWPSCSARRAASTWPTSVAGQATSPARSRLQGQLAAVAGAGRRLGDQRHPRLGRQHVGDGHRRPLRRPRRGHRRRQRGAAAGRRGDDAAARPPRAEGDPRVAHGDAATGGHDGGAEVPRRRQPGGRHPDAHRPDERARRAPRPLRARGGGDGASRSRPRCAPRVEALRASDERARAAAGRRRPDAAADRAGGGARPPGARPAAPARVPA